MKKVRALGLALVGLLVLAVATLWAMGLRPGAGSMKASIEIAAPRETVWTWVTEPAHLKGWVGWVVDVKRRDEKHLTWVMRDENNNNAPMEIEDTLLESRPPEYVRTRMTVAGSFDGTNEFRLTALGPGRTRLDSYSVYKYDHWLAKLVEPMISKAAEDKLVQDLNRLKSQMEAPPVRN